MESKSNLSNVDSLCSWTFPRSIITKIIHGRNAFFKLVLDKDLELRHFTNWVVLLVVHFLPFMVDAFVEIKFDCVVSSSDSFDIEINEFILLNLLYVIHINYSKQIDKHANTADHKAKSLSLVHIWEFAFFSFSWWWQLSLSNKARSL